MRRAHPKSRCCDSPKPELPHLLSPCLKSSTTCRPSFFSSFCSDVTFSLSFLLVLYLNYTIASHLKTSYPVFLVSLHSTCCLMRCHMKFSSDFAYYVLPTHIPIRCVRTRAHTHTLNCKFSERRDFYEFCSQ